jgi:hypothetical protein
LKFFHNITTPTEISIGLIFPPRFAINKKKRKKKKRDLDRVKLLIKLPLKYTKL